MGHIWCQSSRVYFSKIFRKIKIKYDKHRVDFKNAVPPRRWTFTVFGGKWPILTLYFGVTWLSDKFYSYSLNRAKIAHHFCSWPFFVGILSWKLQVIKVISQRNRLIPVHIIYNLEFFTLTTCNFPGSVPTKNGQL